MGWTDEWMNEWMNGSMGRWIAFDRGEPKDSVARPFSKPKRGMYHSTYCTQYIYIRTYMYIKHKIFEKICYNAQEVEERVRQRHNSIVVAAEAEDMVWTSKMRMKRLVVGASRR